MALRLKLLLAAFCLLTELGLHLLDQTEDGLHVRERDFLDWYIKTSNYSTVFELNMWYRYAQILAKSQNQTNCYVCTRMPIASTNPYIVPRPVVNASSLFPHILRSSFSATYLNQTHGNVIVQPAPNISMLNYTYFLRTNDTKNDRIYGPVHLDVQTKFDCYYSSYNFSDIPPIPMGTISPRYCSQTSMPCSKNASGGYNETGKPPGVNCAKFFTVPDVMGTIPQTNLVWLCGVNIFLSLPTGWTGVCAPVIPTDHSYIVSATLQQTGTRRRRNVATHDSISGSDVPSDSKLWTTGQKVTLSLFPWLGVGKVMLRMETLDYRFGVFLKSTIAALKSVNKEITALRLVALQNRIVLDQLTAASGGVCTVIGTSCCTFIPDLAGDHGAIESAITNLTQMRDTMNKNHVTDRDWFFSMFSGSWMNSLKQILLMIGVFLLLLCIFSSCVIPCTRSMISKMVSVQVQGAYVALLMQEPEEEEENSV